MQIDAPLFPWLSVLTAGVTVAFGDEGVDVEVRRRFTATPPTPLFLEGASRAWRGPSLADHLAALPVPIQAPPGVTDELGELWVAWRAGRVDATEAERRLTTLMRRIEATTTAAPPRGAPGHAGSEPLPEDHLLFASTDGGPDELHLTLEVARGIHRRVDELGCAFALARALDRRPDVRDLTISSTCLHHGTLLWASEVLAHRRPPVERLRIGALTFPDHARGEVPPAREGGDGSSWRMGGVDIAPLVAALPTLTHLTVQVNDVAVRGVVTAPALTSLLLRTPDPEGLGDAWRALASWSLPALEELEVWAGDLDFGWGEADASALDPLLRAPHFPSLRRLRLLSDLTDDVVARLAESPLLPGLTDLDVSDGTLSDAGADLLLARWERFEHLRRLTLTGNLLSRDAVTALRARAGRALVVGTQRWCEDTPRCDLRPVSLFLGWERP